MPPEWPLINDKIKNCLQILQQRKEPVQFAKKLKMEEAEPKDNEDLQKTVSAFLAAEHIDVGPQFSMHFELKVFDMLIVQRPKIDITL